MDLFSMPTTTVPTPAPSTPSAALSRDQVLDEIISINPSATADFLTQFADDLLKKYLDHLLYTQGPRDGSSPWDRPNDAPAIMVRRRVV